MVYTPMYGGDPILGFAPQFESEPVNPLSMAVTPILLKALPPSEGTVSSASGALWVDGSRNYLVTARHVLSGTSAFDESVNSKGFRPISIEVYPGARRGATFSRFGPMSLDLYDSDGRGRWLEDPEFDRLRTDIALLPFATPVLPSYELVSLNRDDYSKKLVSSVGMELVILGYPTANLSGGMTPIWRKGLLASEPSLAIDGKPIFLVDAATGPSFSGAPVFRQHVGPAPHRSDDGKINVRVHAVISRELVGIYSGRLSHTHAPAETAFAFYANRIPEIIRSQTRTICSHPDK